MIYALLIGAVLGIGHVPLSFGVPMLVTLVLFKGLSEILSKKDFFTGKPSPYVLYLQKLKKTNSLGLHPWRGYLLQVLGFGCLIGFVAYSVASVVF